MLCDYQFISYNKRRFAIRLTESSIFSLTTLSHSQKCSKMSLLKPISPWNSEIGSKSCCVECDYQYTCDPPYAGYQPSWQTVRTPVIRTWGLGIQKPFSYASCIRKGSKKFLENNPWKFKPIDISFSNLAAWRTPSWTRGIGRMRTFFHQAPLHPQLHSSLDCIYCKILNIKLNKCESNFNSYLRSNVMSNLKVNIHFLNS